MTKRSQLLSADQTILANKLQDEKQLELVGNLYRQSVIMLDPEFLAHSIGFKHSGPGIGDRMIWTSLPENYFRNTGRKLIDTERQWAYDFNPYVIRGEKPEKIVDLWKIPPRRNCYTSMAHRVAEEFALSTVYLRHPRLYIFEDIPLDAQTVIVHATGRTVKSMPDDVIAHIAEAYKNYNIIQIGGLRDRETPFIDKRGLHIRESIKLIASSGTFIGVDSGMMHIANCYPRVRRKVVLLRNEEKLKPMTKPTHFIDFNWEYYNTTSFDQGVSMSYLKI